MSLSRQATPSLVDVAGSHNADILTTQSSPLSSTTARARQAELDAHALQQKRAHQAAVASKYPKTDFRNVESIQPYLPPKTSAAVGQLLDTTRLAMKDILLQADPFLAFEDSELWVPGWQRPIHQALNKAVPRNTASTSSAEVTALLAGFFTQVNQRLADGMHGGDAFKHLLRLLASQFGEQDRGQSFTILNDFGVPSGTTFAKFLQQYKVKVSNVTNYSGLIAPDDRWIVEITRNKINDQFPGMAMFCFPGTLADAPNPYESVDDMWRAFDAVATNKTQASNGERFSTAMVVPSFSQLSLRSSSGGSRSSTRSSRGAYASASPSGYVMNVQPHVASDVFDQYYAAWPLGSDEHWETVFNVSENFHNQFLPPLWTPLTSRQDRERAFREHNDHCLNCGGTSHSMRNCTEPFKNVSGILNPELGLLNDKDDAFQAWLQRMRSHKQSHPQNNHSRRDNGAGSHHRHSDRRSDRRPRHDNRQHHHSNTAAQPHSTAAAERFRARHVSNYQQQQTPAVSVYQPNSGAAASPVVNAVTHAAGNRYHSMLSSNNNPNRSPYTGRG